MYNYLESIIDDVKMYIENEINFDEYDSLEDLEQELSDNLWTEDSVTGNGSGSYTFNREEAKEYVLDNTNELRDALKDFCVDADTIAEKFLDEDWEYFDVTIRCYLLGQAISEVMEEIEDDFEEYKEQQEEEEE